MKNKIAQITLAALSFGTESTLEYIYSLAVSDHGGIIAQVHQDLVVKIGFQLLCLLLGFLSARLARAEFSLWPKIRRAGCCLAVILVLLFCEGFATDTKVEFCCKNHVRKTDLKTHI